MKNQKSTIKTLNKNKKIKEVKIIENKIKQNIKDFKNFKITLNDNIFTSKNKIMGFEGIASVNYWEAVSLLLPDEINFKNRNQKPENDVVNSMLNYGYAILASEIAKNIVTLGLDPYCGLLHADLKRRQSLIFDLIEEFRLGDTKDKLIFDLYSGTGTIAQMLSPVASKVIGVEIVEEAVEAARENAKSNGLDNCEFIAGDVLKVIDTIEEKPDLIILDPPRDGINPKALLKIINYGVNEIVYISCKPTSLARDLVTLQEHGYYVKKACAVDQFVNTGHVETCVLLEKTSATHEV